MCMENKYLDKVVESILRGTKIDYGTGRVYTPFLPYPLLLSHLSSFSFFLSTSPPLPFFKYCVNHFGLTEEEIEYVWDKYKDIIDNKISYER